MHNSDFHHERSYDSHKIRRIVGTAGMLISLIIILSVGAFTTREGIIPAISGVIRTTSSGIITSGNPQTASSCNTPSHQPGDSNLSIHSAGLARTFIVHLAPTYGIQPQPVVINYHGYDNTAQRTAQHTNMGAEADRGGFILVFPQAVDSPPSWNAGIGALGPTGTADDVQFTRDLISFFEHNYCVDTHRIYVTGYSEGGGMAYRVACALGNQIAAFATVEGAFFRVPGGCNPARPIPLLEIHGQADHLAPYDGNAYLGMAAVQVF